MIKPNTVVKLRGGLTARIGFTDKKGPRPISGLVDFGEREDHQTWYADGRVSEYLESDYDIIMPEPERKSRWINLYSEAYGTAVYFETRERADSIAGRLRTHVLEIITENGEPVDVKIHKVTK